MNWIIQSPLDMHLHVRQGDMLQAVLPATTGLFAGAVIMPNLVPPVTDLAMLIAYRDDIMRHTTDPSFQPYMTLFFRDYSAAELEAARPHIIGVKLYPEGVTTNSEHGVRDALAYDKVLDAMQALDIPLLVHGETHGFVMDREREYMSVYDSLARRFPRLRIVMEHISTRDALPLLDRHENLFATVTVHHLLLTLDDLAGGLLQPHLFCKPILKTPADREALQAAVLSGHPKLMFGSDSAPHPVDKKESCGCAAGLFTAPVAIALLAEFFHRHQATDLLQGFLSDHARRIYRLNPPAKKVRIEQTPWRVPERYGTVRPYRAGETVPWKASVSAP